MIPEVSLITVIGLGLFLVLYIAKWWYERNSAKVKAIEDEDKIIDSANDSTALLREFDKLSDK